MKIKEPNWVFARISRHGLSNLVLTGAGDRLVERTPKSSARRIDVYQPLVDHH